MRCHPSSVHSIPQKVPNTVVPQKKTCTQSPLNISNACFLSLSICLPRHPCLPLILTPLITSSSSDCLAQYLSLQMYSGWEVRLHGECMQVPRAFPARLLSSGERLIAALIVTRLTPPLHNFNTSFYAGIWGYVCL